jgi:hypothetical protein
MVDYFRRATLMWLLVSGLILVLFVFIKIILSSSTTPNMWVVCNEVKTFQKKNLDHLLVVYGFLFEEAKNCHHNEVCEATVSQKILQSFSDSEKVTQFPSTYFIKLSENGVIEKLFLSGRYETDRVDTTEERKALAVLEGKRKEICTEGWRLEDGTGADMTYLHDIYSEAEAIIPVRIDNKLLGAIVKGYGD